MNKVLLTAASAFVFTIAASAQTFQVSGEVMTEVAYNGYTNEFNGPLFWTDDFALTMLGNSGGWEYQVELQFNGDVGQVQLENASLGTFQLHHGAIEWKKSLLDGSMQLSTHFETRDIIGTLMMGLEGNAAGISYNVAIWNDAFRTFGLELELPILGVEFGADVEGHLADTSSLTYTLGLGFDAFGVETDIMWGDAGDMAIEAHAGAFYVYSELTDGDLFNDLILGYQQEVTEQMEVKAEAGMAGGATTASTLLTLRF